MRKNNQIKQRALVVYLAGLFSCRNLIAVLVQGLLLANHVRPQRFLLMPHITAEIT